MAQVMAQVCGKYGSSNVSSNGASMAQVMCQVMAQVYVKKWLKYGSSISQVKHQEYDQSLYKTTWRNINIALLPNYAVGKSYNGNQIVLPYFGVRKIELLF
jgi:hypothetical protein